MSVDDARNFVIWITESYIPRVEADGALSDARLLRVLSHHDQESECFSLQFRTADSATLHQWYVRQGKALVDEMTKMFGERFAGFSTLMEEIN